MSFSAGICPSCKDYILQKDGVPFLTCPICGDQIIAREAAELLDTECLNPARVHENMAKCLKLEEEFGPELPVLILSKMADAFPTNEEVGFMLVRMSGYSPYFVKVYLTRFAVSNKEVPFAGEFLEHALTFKNFAHADLFGDYINNKFRGSYRVRWLEKLSDMRTVIRNNSYTAGAIKFLYIYYILGLVLNIGYSAFAVATDILPFIALLGILFALFVSEVAVLFLHNRRFGNRVSMSELERAVMVAFMCSIVVAVGSLFVGLAV